VEHAVGNWDAYGYNRGKNMYAYKPANGKWMLLPWDIDFVLGSGSDGATSDVFGCNDPVISRMYGHPPFLRAYWRAFRDLVNGPLKAENLGAILDGRYQALVANGISLANPAGIKSYVQQRRDYLISRLNTVNAPFAITSNNGNNFTSAKTFVSLAGTAPIDVKTIEVNGVAYPVTWTGLTAWTLGVPLAPGNNNLAVTGLDLRGQLVAGAADSIVVNCTGATANPAGSVVINEIHYHPLKPDSEFVEIHNTSATATFDLTGWRLEGADFTFPEGSLLAPNGFQVVVKNRAGFTAAFGPNVIPLGEYPGSLDHGGETLRLLMPAAVTNEYGLVDIVRYDDKLPWPAAADGQGPSLQLIDPLQDNGRAGNWAAAPTNATILATPGAANTVQATLAAFPKLWINEVQPENIGAIKDASGKAGPWIELYNAGSTAVNLAGLYLSQSPSNLTAWAFPESAVVGAGQYVLIWADGDTSQTTAGEIHAGFKLDPETGYVVLSRMQQGVPAAIDYLKYEQLAVGRSFGSLPDGQPDTRRLMHYPTPGAANNPEALPLQVFVNEWMAANGQTLADPADQRFDDWFELYNASQQEADLSGYYLSDTLTNATQWLIPAGTVIPARGHLLIWADGDTGQNGLGVHAGFKLNATGESIALFTPNGNLVDAVTFGPQTADISQGRWPDGAPEPFFPMPIPTPGAPNSIAAGNHPPIIPLIPEQIVTEGETAQFTVGAIDVDRPAQTLTYSLDAGAPTGATLDPVTGLFAWTPAGAQVPGTNLVTIRVTDNGDPAQSSVRTVRIVTLKLNHAPVLEPVASVTVSEGSLLSLTLKASDGDAGQALRFFLASGAQQGMSLDLDTGRFTWTPGESQGPGSYAVVVSVLDNGVPALSASQSFTINVAEVNTPPALAPVPDQLVQQGGTLSLPLVGSDGDWPTQTLVYSLVEASLPGANVDPATGVLTWTPTDAQIPGTNRITVRVTDNGAPPLSATRTIDVVATRPPPWKYFTTTGTASASLLYVYLTGPGDLYLDDLKLVAGAAPEVGANTVLNGDFESALSGAWTVSANHAASAVVTNTFHAGKSCLHVAASSGGTTKASSIYQTINPALTSGGAYTLSYWCLPGSNQVDLVIRLSGFGILSSNTIVAAPNTAPRIAEIPRQELQENTGWSCQVLASDTDLPAQQLNFSLEPGAPAGMIISAAGLISWTPGEAQAPSTNTVTVKVTDNGTPALSATLSFLVVVKGRATAPQISSIETTSANRIQITWISKPGAVYRLQYKPSLSDPQWAAVDSLVASETTTSVSVARGPASQGFYRIEVVSSP
jgi:hypothetical protein